LFYSLKKILTPSKDAVYDVYRDDGGKAFGIWNESYIDLRDKFFDLIGEEPPYFHDTLDLDLTDCPCLSTAMELGMWVSE
jgi:hypothetical protein